MAGWWVPCLGFDFGGCIVVKYEIRDVCGGWFPIFGGYGRIGIVFIWVLGFWYLLFWLQIGVVYWNTLAFVGDGFWWVFYMDLDWWFLIGMGCVILGCGWPNGVIVKLGFRMFLRSMGWICVVFPECDFELLLDKMKFWSDWWCWLKLWNWVLDGIQN